jgi:hypothetical protein
MAYCSFVRPEHQSFLRRIQGTTSSLLPIHNITMNNNNLIVNVRWTLRNRMTERTSHMSGLWIGAVISNTSHSNKPGSTTVKQARLTGKGSRWTAVLPQ